MKRGGGVVVRRLSVREIGGNGGCNQEVVAVQGVNCARPAERQLCGDCDSLQKISGYRHSSCGRKQSGGYLEGAAPDGVWGLGPGSISVPTLLEKAGLIHNSFTICFNENDSGRILFGDQGHATQQSTPFFPVDGEFVGYIVGVERFCVGSLCVKETGFQALIDSGASFTYLPNEVYKKVVVGRRSTDGFQTSRCLFHLYKGIMTQVRDFHIAKLCPLQPCQAKFGTGVGASQGVLIKEGQALESSHKAYGDVGGGETFSIILSVS